MSLQSRYGDPRVYAQQQEQMARDQAAVAHSKSQKTAQLLEDAYERQKERNRVQHNTRIMLKYSQIQSNHARGLYLPATATTVVTRHSRDTEGDRHDTE